MRKKLVNQCVPSSRGELHVVLIRVLSLSSSSGETIREQNKAWLHARRKEGRTEGRKEVSQRINEGRKAGRNE